MSFHTDLDQARKQNNAAACANARHWAYRHLSATEAEIERTITMLSFGYFADPEPIHDVIYSVLIDAARNA